MGCRYNRWPDVGRGPAAACRRSLRSDRRRAGRRRADLPGRAGEPIPVRATTRRSLRRLSRASDCGPPWCCSRARRAALLSDAHPVLAAVVEMIHTATLVHDDILDEAMIRRHAATVNAEWGNETAVLLGDYLFTHAFHLAASLDSTRACRWIGHATNKVCEGEMQQVHHRGNLDLDEATYFAIIEGKTAELTAVSLPPGGLVRRRTGVDRRGPRSLRPQPGDRLPDRRRCARYLGRGARDRQEPGHRPREAEAHAAHHPSAPRPKPAAAADDPPAARRGRSPITTSTPPLSREAPARSTTPGSAPSSTRSRRSTPSIAWRIPTPSRCCGSSPSTSSGARRDTPISRNFTPSHPVRVRMTGTRRSATFAEFLNPNCIWPLIRYHSPSSTERSEPLPPNRPRIARAERPGHGECSGSRSGTIFASLQSHQFPASGRRRMVAVMELKDKLQMLMARQSLERAEAGRLSQVSDSEISRILQGKSRPGLDNAFRLAKIGRCLARLSRRRQSGCRTAPAGGPHLAGGAKSPQPRAENRLLAGHDDPREHPVPRLRGRHEPPGRRQADHRDRQGEWASCAALVRRPRQSGIARAQFGDGLSVKSSLERQCTA